MAIHRPPGHHVESDKCIHVIGYARVKGAPADQARLLALQWERMRRFVLEHASWTIVGEFSDITTRRPAGTVPGLRQALALDEYERMRARRGRAAGSLKWTRG